MSAASCIAEVQARRVAGSIEWVAAMENGPGLAAGLEKKPERRLMAGHRQPRNQIPRRKAVVQI